MRHIPDKIFKLNVTTARSYQGHTTTMHTYSPQPISLPSITFLPLIHSKTKSRKDFIGQGNYSKIKGQIKVIAWYCTPTPSNQCHYHVSTFHILRFLRYSPDKILKVKVTAARSKVKSRSHHVFAHLHPLTNIPTKYQLPTPYRFWDTDREKSKVKSRSHHDLGHLHPPTNVPTSVKFLCLTVAEI